MSRRRWLAVFAATVVALGCSARPGPAPPRLPVPTASATATAPGPQASPSPSPARMTLDEEVGAVIMVGFQGELTEALVQDWSRHQYGGLLVVNLNHNGASSAVIGATISRLRAVHRGRLLAATDQEGGGICIALADIPCAPGPAGREESARMAAALHGIGFDIDLGPVADVCSVPRSIMAGRCYGADTSAVSTAVGDAIDGIHDGHMLAATKHFPGHGATTVSSENRLPVIEAGVSTLSERDWPPFRTAAAHGSDLMLVGHLHLPALDGGRAASLSPAAFARLRDDIGFRGAIISDDFEMDAITASTPTPEAAVEFLIAGGDMAMVGHHIEVADATFDAIRAAVIAGRLPRSRLDAAVAALEALPRR